MKIMTTAILALLLSVGISSAQAADLGSSRGSGVDVSTLSDGYQKSFTGAYIGVNGSLITGDYDVSEVHEEADDPYDFTSGLFGFHAGYDHQISPRLVLGIVGDIGWSGANVSKRVPYRDVSGVPGFAEYKLNQDPEGVSLVGKLELNQLATIRGRIGVLANPQLLIYGTGGVAFGWSEATVTCSGCTPSDLYNSKETHVGYAVGGGFDYHFADHWSAGLEYLYVNLGDEDYGVDKAAVDLDAHLIKAQLSYRF